MCFLSEKNVKVNNKDETAGKLQERIFNAEIVLKDHLLLDANFHLSKISSFLVTLSLIQWLSHHSTGLTNTPFTIIPK